MPKKNTKNQTSEQLIIKWFRKHKVGRLCDVANATNLTENDAYITFRRIRKGGTQVEKFRDGRDNVYFIPSCCE